MIGKKEELGTSAQKIERIQIRKNEYLNDSNGASPSNRSPEESSFERKDNNKIISRFNDPRCISPNFQQITKKLKNANE